MDVHNAVGVLSVLTIYHTVHIISTENNRQLNSANKSYSIV